MKSTIQVNIERRESGTKAWTVFCPNVRDDAYEMQMELWAHSYPRHHFRAVRVTKTAEVLKEVPAKWRALNEPHAPNPTR